MKAPNPYLLAAMILPPAVLLSQCAPTGGASRQPDTGSPVASQHWAMVSSKPPTYYPRGVAADAPTDCLAASGFTPATRGMPGSSFRYMA